MEEDADWGGTSGEEEDDGNEEERDKELKVAAKQEEADASNVRNIPLRAVLESTQADDVEHETLGPIGASVGHVVAILSKRRELLIRHSYPYEESYLSRQHMTDAMKLLRADFKEEPWAKRFASDAWQDGKNADWVSRNLKSRWRGVLCQRYGHQAWAFALAMFGELPKQLVEMVHAHYNRAAPLADARAAPYNLSEYGRHVGVAHKRTSFKLRSQAATAELNRRQALWHFHNSPSTDWWLDWIREAQTVVGELTHGNESQSLPTFLTDYVALHPQPPRMTPLQR
jgi:hypothetical protein